MRHVISALAGLGLLGTAAHATVLATGGYQSTHAIVTWAAAAALAAGSIIVASAWHDGRRGLAIALAIALIAGEVYTLGATAERIVTSREAQQTPLRDALAVRESAALTLRDAEARLLAAPSTSARLTAALSAKAAADASTRDQASLVGCRANCAALLSQQAQAAESEVTAARAELAVARTQLQGAVDAARTKLAGLPMPASAAPLADRLGAQPWAIDVVLAVLGAVGINGTGGLLLAYGAHWRRREEVVKPAPRQEEVVHPAPIPDIVRLPPPMATPEHAAGFLKSTLRPDPGGRISARDLHTAYVDWCRFHGYQPQAQIGAEIGRLLLGIGLEITPEREIVGARLAR